MKKPGIITLTTDFGLSDPYVPAMKGVILSINPTVRLVDISHEVEAGSIFQAAYLIKEIFPFFPDATVHLVVVDPGVGGDRRPIAIEMERQFLVGPDNGIFWPLIKEQKETRIVHLSEKRYFQPTVSHTFHGRDIFAPVAAHIALGVELEKLGVIINDPVKMDIPLPHRKGDAFFGQVIRADNFGNLITNIHRRELELFLESGKPVIEIGDITINGIRDTYESVGEGEPLALFNSSDYLEIAVNSGQADEYCDLEKGKITGALVKVYRKRERK